MKLTVHGNGFIQVPLENGARMHVWSPDVPRQESRTVVHDHRFQFESRVIKGSLENRLYILNEDPKGPWKVYTPGATTLDHDSLFDTRKRGWLDFSVGQQVLEGERYEMPACVFHETVPTSTYLVTVMRKLSVFETHAPRVLVPEGNEPDNDFVRYWNQDRLWAIVQGALTTPNPK